MQPTNTPFPSDALPDVMRDYVREAAESIGCHESYIALPLMASLARAIGNKRIVKLKPSWTEPAIIWGAIVSDSGDLKSPSQKAATSFLQKLEERSNDLHYTSTDATYAGLRDCLNGHPDASLLLMPDELIEVFQSLGRGGQSALKKGQWLSCWSASSLKIHRAKNSINIPRAAVSIVGGIQPGTFRDVVKRERSIQDGMCARFLLTYQTQDKSLRWNEKRVKHGTRVAMSDVFERLDGMDAEYDQNGSIKPTAIPLTAPAVNRFRTFLERFDREAIKCDPDLKAACRKLEAYAGRFALIFQLVTWASKEAEDRAGNEDLSAKNVKVSGVTMRNAINLVHWFKEEAKRTYQMLSETPADAARRELVERIKKNGGSMTARDLARHSFKYKTSQQATDALNDLRNHGLAEWRQEVSGKQGGRPSRRLYLIDQKPRTES